jgi:hypothetical protein
VPVLLFLNVRQVFVYDTVKEDVETLEESQREWLERNKRMIAGIAVLRSPERVEELAREELEIKKLDKRKLLRIEVPNKNEEDEDG